MCVSIIKKSKAFDVNRIFHFFCCSYKSEFILNLFHKHFNYKVIKNYIHSNNGRIFFNSCKLEKKEKKRWSVNLINLHKSKTVRVFSKNKSNKKWAIIHHLDNNHRISVNQQHLQLHFNEPNRYVFLTYHYNQLIMASLLFNGIFQW